MNEAACNAILVKSINDAFKNKIICHKTHGNMFTKSEPDITGSFFGMKFDIEGKVAHKTQSWFLKSDQYTIGQKAKMIDLMNAGCLVMISVYKFDEGKLKGVYLCCDGDRIAKIFDEGVKCEADLVDESSFWLCVYDKQRFDVIDYFKFNFVNHNHERFSKFNEWLKR
jgi:hypothetical protein